MDQSIVCKIILEMLAQPYVKLLKRILTSNKESFEIYHILVIKIIAYCSTKIDFAEKLTC